MCISCITVTTRIWSSPYSGQIRLRGGTYSSYGRLEVYCNRQWGTVCNNTFDSTDAKAACRQLGYSNYNTYEILLVKVNSDNNKINLFFI